MLSDEISKGMGGVFASRYSRLHARQEAADKINKMFGTNITVEFNDVETDNTDSTQSEVNENE